uniref:Taste receptor type 2 n=1 Tax=Leptobrachium leishanense TaxID=445787 RepID=A0A8C5R6M3_9ANUR
NENEKSSTLSRYDYITLISLILETLLGSLGNSFIVAVNLCDLLTHGELNSFDLILTCLGLSRWVLQFLVLTVFVISIGWKSSGSKYSESLQYSWLFYSNSSMWFATWLCVLYCVRIANIQNFIFNLLKKHFDRLLPWFLMASVAISVVFNSTETGDEPFFLGSKNFASFSTLCALGSLPPFLIFCTAALMVVSSLMKHVQKMKEQEKTGFREPSVKAHYGAVMSIGLFFIFYLFYMVTFNIYISQTVDSSLVKCFCAVTIGAYPSIHSLFLVHGNNKLRYIMVGFLKKVCCFGQECFLPWSSSTPNRLAANPITCAVLQIFGKPGLLGGPENQGWDPLS